MRSTIPIAICIVSLATSGALASVEPAKIDKVWRLTEPDLRAGSPAFSPDGSRIAFDAGPKGQGEIYVIGVDGQGLTRLTKGGGDDRSPTWSSDGSRIVWSRAGGSGYDLWLMQADGKGARQLTSHRGDELQPTMSPLEYAFFAVIADSCSSEGAYGSKLGNYEKVVYTRRVKGRPEVWFVSLDGRHEGRVSPKGKACKDPRYSANGLSLAFSCGGESVVYDTRAVWDQGFGAALKAVGYDQDEGGLCDDLPNADNWDKDACFKKVERRYAQHAADQHSKAGRLKRPAYSANQILLMGESGDAVSWRSRARTDDARRFHKLALGGDASAPVWSPDGTTLAFSSTREGKPAIFLAATDFYLQEVGNLVDYPELWGAKASQKLHDNRFVARTSKEKEFFHHYEKLNYRRRAPFVTADAAMQVFHDEFANILKAREHTAQTELKDLTGALMAHYATQRGESARWMATAFATAHALLVAAEKVQKPDQDFYPGATEEDRAADPSALDQIKAAFPGALDVVPGALRPRVASLVDKILAHSGLEKLKIPSYDDEVTVDFTQFKVRGHYTGSRLAGYFLAMNWLALAPLPVDDRGEGLGEVLAGLKVDRASGMALWKGIDQFVGAFMGRPVDVTVAHLEAAHAEGLSGAKAWKRALELRGPMPIKGPDGMFSGRYGARLSLFPKRLGQDVAFFSALTHPSVDQRGFPAALDVLASMGVDRATHHALHSVQSATWAAAYKAKLAELVADHGARPATFWSTDVYHAWLALLESLARHHDRPSAARLRFTQSDAWKDRKLVSALAGYTVLKHDAVLYAFQDYSAECGGDESLVAFVEQPLLPMPRGFVDPEPEFFAALSKLAGRVYKDMNGGVEPDVEDPYAMDEDEGVGEKSRLNARSFTAQLAAIAAKQVKGQVPSEAEYVWLNRVAVMMEAMFLGREKQPAFAFGGDEGRLKRGLALVTDVHTNPVRQQVLQLGVGRVLDLFVAVPDAPSGGERMTQGGMYSFYEFTHPMSDRLTDDQWNELLESGRAPAPPAWTQSFWE